jgi:hypothetical protein
MSRPACARCGRRREVAYTAFNVGEATFRPLCLDCERVELPQNQPLLLEIPIPEGESQAAPISLFDPIAQMSLF